MIKMFAALQEVPVPVADAPVSPWVWIDSVVFVLGALAVCLLARSAAHRRGRRIAQQAEGHTRARLIAWEGVGGFPPHSFPQRRVGIYLPGINVVVIRFRGALEVIWAGDGTALYKYEDLGEVAIPLELFEAAKSLLGSGERLNEHIALVGELLTPYDLPPRFDQRTTPTVVSKPD